MKQYWECHITLADPGPRARACVERVGWTFSRITDDPDLGPGVKCYATLQLNIRLTEEEVLARLAKAADDIRAQEITVLREKIERVVYDKRTPIAA